jgi:exopolysaccharide production protein ExoQ
MDAQSERLTAIRLMEGLVTLGLVLMMSNALIGPVLDPDQTGGDSNAILRLMWLPVYAAAGALALLRAPNLARMWLPGLLLGALVLWAALSVTWSIDPGVSQRRAIAVAASTLFGLYLAARYDGRSLAELLASSFLILALGSYAVSLALPSLGVHADVNAGAWRGLWYEKNQMGATMVYGALTCAAAAALAPGRRLLWLATLGLCVGLIVMTQSKTSLLALALGLGLGGGLSLMNRGPAAAVALIWLGVTLSGLLGGLYLLAPEVLFDAMGKDASLTGRTDIWSAVMRAAEARPLQGYGFAAFWTDDSTPAKWIRHQLGWTVPTAHSGWMDLLVQLGMVGVGLFALVLGAAFLAALARFGRTGDGGWAVMLLAVFTLQILSESFILAHNSLPWVLAVTAIARLLGPLPVRAAGLARLSSRAARPNVLAAPPYEPAPVDWTDQARPVFGRRGLATA